MPTGELTALPQEVRAKARIYDNGEVSWALSHAERAIDALADAGFVILGLDVRWHDDQGHTRETACSDFNPARDVDDSQNVEIGRQTALEALWRENTADFGDWILVTWRNSRRSSAESDIDQLA